MINCNLDDEKAKIIEKFLLLLNDKEDFSITIKENPNLTKIGYEAISDALPEDSIFINDFCKLSEKDNILTNKRPHMIGNVPCNISPAEHFIFINLIPKGVDGNRVRIEGSDIEISSEDMDKILEHIPTQQMAGEEKGWFTIKCAIYNASFSDVDLERFMQRIVDIGQVHQFGIAFHNCRLSDKQIEIITDKFRQIKKGMPCLSISNNPEMTAKSKKILYDLSDKNRVIYLNHKNLTEEKAKHVKNSFIFAASIALGLGGIVGGIAGFIKAKFFHSSLNRFNLSNKLFGAAIAGGTIIVGVASFMASRQIQKSNLFGESETVKNNRYSSK